VENDLILFNSETEFQPRQIVCLQHQNQCLYGELIQFIAKRQLYWVRPLLLAIAPQDFEHLFNWSEVEECFDARDGSDLILPTSLFRLALDTEVIPLLTQLHLADTNANNGNSQEIQPRLHALIRQVWQANQQTFQKHSQKGLQYGELNLPSNPQQLADSDRPIAG
jgi:hypothetical protein